jgi:hypothetical protein
LNVEIKDNKLMNSKGRESIEKEMSTIPEINESSSYV